MPAMTFAELVEMYASYRRACGMKERPMQDIRYFFNACVRMPGGSPYLTQEMIDWWWEKRRSEIAVTHRARLNKVRPFLEYIIVLSLIHI